MSAKEAEAYLPEKLMENFTLFNVRHPEEYEAGHIPGAKFIPLGPVSKSYPLFKAGMIYLTFDPSSMKMNFSAGTGLGPSLNKI